MRIGIIGAGCVGGTLLRWLHKHTTHNLFVFDKKLKMLDDISRCPVVFICVPAATLSNGKQDLTYIRESIARCHDDSEIFIRSTILPGTSDMLGKEFSKKVYFCPEFLSMKTADADMELLPIISTKTDILKEVFKFKEIINATNFESELIKIAHNSYAGVKINYFNIINKFCQDNNVDYNKIRDLMLVTGFINKMHTEIPGHDGRLGFGGACLRKDIKAFSSMIDFSELLNVTISDNDKFRGKE